MEWELLVVAAAAEAFRGTAVAVVGHNFQAAAKKTLPAAAAAERKGFLAGVVDYKKIPVAVVAAVVTWRIRRLVPNVAHRSPLLVVAED